MFESWYAWPCLFAPGQEASFDSQVRTEPKEQWRGVHAARRAVLAFVRGERELFAEVLTQLRRPQLAATSTVCTSN